MYRDIKPDNILLDTATGRAMVTGFGIAAVAGERREGPVSGTVGFISPEQLAGEPADRRSDLYSLGVVAHLALTGTMPDADSSLGGPAEGVTAPLSAAVAGCLSPDPVRNVGDEAARSVEVRILPADRGNGAQAHFTLDWLPGRSTCHGVAVFPQGAATQNLRAEVEGYAKP